ncbi:hypothetical protein CALCODRAFT_554892, partial [Calocera cornea HHB12733]
MASNPVDYAGRAVQVIRASGNSTLGKIATAAADLSGITKYLEESGRDWAALGDHVNQRIHAVLAGLPEGADVQPSPMKQAVERLQSCVNKITLHCSEQLRKTVSKKLALSRDSAKQLSPSARNSMMQWPSSSIQMTIEMANLVGIEKLVDRIKIDELIQRLSTQIKADTGPDPRRAIT